MEEEGQICVVHTKQVFILSATIFAYFIRQPAILRTGLIIFALLRMLPLYLPVYTCRDMYCRLVPSSR